MDELTEDELARGEDYFSADNAHSLILIDPSGMTAKVLWTGSDSGSNSMGVCVSCVMITAAPLPVSIMNVCSS